MNPLNMFWSPWRVIHEQADKGSLAFARFVVFGFWAIYLTISPIELVGELPLEIARPVRLLELLPHGLQQFCFSGSTLYVLRYVCLGLSLLCMFSDKALRYTGLPLFFALAMIQGILRSWGSVNHGEIAPLLATMILAICATDDLIWPALKKHSGRAFYPLAMICGCICVAYSFVALHRLLDPTVLFDDSMRGWAIKSSYKDNFLPAGFGHLAAQYESVALLLKVGFIVTTLFELLSPVALFHRRFRYVWLIYMAGFHIATMLFMRILFWENMLLYLLFFEGINSDSLPTTGAIWRKIRTFGGHTGSPDVAADL